MRQYLASLSITYRHINFIANVLTVLAVSALAVSALIWVIRLPYFAVNTVKIEEVDNQPLVYVTPSTVSATIAGRLKGNFFTINLDESRALLETAPWVRRVQVKRVWPNTLQVKIEEHQPLAYWNESDMINTWGEPFAANEAVLVEGTQLPQLNGPENSVRLVVQRYGDVTQWLSPLGLSIQQLSLSPRYAWEVVLSDGLRLQLGRDPAADIADLHGTSGAEDFARRLERFVQAWPTLNERVDGRVIERADLRYSNGFAIRLAPPKITE